MIDYFAILRPGPGSCDLKGKQHCCLLTSGRDDEENGATNQINVFMCSGDGLFAG